MAITYVGTGAFASGTGALTVALPTGTTTGDLLLLTVESANEVIATPAGYTQVTNSPQFTGTAAAAGGVRLGCFYKVHSGTEGSVTVADTGNHTTATIIAFRGVDTQTPVRATAGDATTVSSSIVFPPIDVDFEGSTIVFVAALDRDAAATGTSVGGSLSALRIFNSQKRLDQTISSGVGGGLAIFTGDYYGPGNIGEVTCTAVTPAAAVLTLALRPKVRLAANITSTPTVFNPTGTAFFLPSALRATPQNLYYFNDTSFVISADGGETWSPTISTGLSNGPATIAVGGDTGNRILVAQSGVLFTGYRIVEGGIYGLISFPIATSRVVYVGGLFIVVGGAGTDTVGFSTTGENGSWTTSTLPAVGDWFITKDGPLFVAASTSGLLATSSDAITWTARSMPAGATYGREVGYGAGVYVRSTSSATKTVAVSTDGITWSAVNFTAPAGTDSWGYVKYFKGAHYVLNGTGPTYAKSTDGGLSWTGGSSHNIDSHNSEAALISDVYVKGTALGGIERAVLGGVNTTQSEATTYLRSKKYATTTDVTPVEAGSVQAVVSDAWGTLTSSGGGGPAAQLQASASGVATGSGTLTSSDSTAANAFAVSTASANLTTQTPIAANIVVGGFTSELTGLNSSGDWIDIAFDGTKWIALQSNSEGVSSTTDGVTWSPYYLGTAAGVWYGLTHANGLWMAVRRDSGTALRSVDGITWTEPTMPFVAGWIDIAYGNGMWVAIASRINGIDPIALCASSPDGITWTQRTLPEASEWAQVQYGNGRFVAIPQSNTFSNAAYSTDGINWVLGGDVGGTGYATMAFGGGKFIALRGDYKAVSSDGVTWAVGSMPSAVYSNLAFGDGIFVAVSSGTNGYAYSTDLGTTFAFANFPTRPTAAWRAVAYGKGRFVAISRTQQVTPSSANIYPGLGARARGDLTTSIRLAGFADGAATAILTVPTSPLPSGTAVATSSSSAALSTQLFLAASVTASATASAPELVGIDALSAESFASAAASGTISSQIRLGATPTATADATAALTALIKLWATAAATQAATGAISTAIRLGGSGAATSSASAVATAQIRLAASVSGAASSSGDLSAAIRFAGASAAESVTSASLSTQLRLEASVASAATANSALVTSVRLQGAAASSTLTSAGLLTQILLAGTSQAVASTTAALTTSALLASQAAGFASAAAQLTNGIRLSSSVSAATEVSATLASVGPAALLAASVQTGAISVGDLVAQVLLYGAPASASHAYAGLITSVRLQAVAVGSVSISAGLSVGPFVASRRRTIIVPREMRVTTAAESRVILATV